MIEFLLQHEFSGSGGLRAQLPETRVTVECKGCPSVWLRAQTDDRAPVTRRIPVEAEADDGGARQRAHGVVTSATMRVRMLWVILAVIAATAVAAWASAAVAAITFRLSSSAFPAGGTVPQEYTCDGTNLSPPLRWTAPPKRTRSFAILMDDPDAPGGTFTHWIGWNISMKARSLRVAQHARREGTNDAGRVGYAGPCPPSGTHRYIFKLYALKAQLKLAPGASRAQFLGAVKGKTLAVARLTSLYSRS